MYVSKGSCDVRVRPVLVCKGRHHLAGSRAQTALETASVDCAGEAEALF